MMPPLLAHTRRVLPNLPSSAIVKNLRTVAAPSPLLHHCGFHSIGPRLRKNQIYDPVRNPNSLTTYLSLSSSSRTPLLTLWTTSYCPTCHRVLPLLQSLLERGVGEPQGGVAFAPIEFDSPDMGSGSSFSESLPMTYMITAVPTLLAFDDAGAPRTGSKVVDGRKMLDERFLVGWIEHEAARAGRGGSGRGGGGVSGGGGGWGAAFGGLFGGVKM
ncbi:hypothetical protein E4U57_006615 [Claviceps arundinis]|uniref:Thioredoxin domain-containing protein n=1 Tax=Claviceps arundinis TaxID=1623583 RepID=A0ABQ7P1P6_9HYPO|nr:hypothetical protein E4U57_006615 [Claviceps arundinis]